jgi:hypothetical protein
VTVTVARARRSGSRSHHPASRDLGVAAGAIRPLREAILPRQIDRTAAGDRLRFPGEELIGSAVNVVPLPRDAVGQRFASPRVRVR